MGRGEDIEVAWVEIKDCVRVGEKNCGWEGREKVCEVKMWMVIHSWVGWTRNSGWR